MNSNLIKYSLHLADTALVLGHRNSEWTGHGPILEQDIALSNIALDLIGQSRNLYQLAAETRNDGSTEDDLAYLRGPDEYLNCLLVEQENGHWGKTILRQFFYSVYASVTFAQLKLTSPPALSSIAEKSLKEVAYHVRWSSEWVIRLGQGTTESNTKMQDAMDDLWKFTDELTVPTCYEHEFIPDALRIKEEWTHITHSVIDKAGISIPPGTIMKSGGKEGKHTPALTTMLEEMQYMQRTYPGMEW